MTEESCGSSEVDAVLGNDIGGGEDGAVTDDENPDITRDGPG